MKKQIVMIMMLVLVGALNVFSNISDADSTKGKYPLDDPRNPNCPCHRYQAQADREYAMLNDKNVVNPQAVPFNNNSDKASVRKTRIFHWKTGLCRKRQPKQPVRKRFRDKLSRCFHF